MKVKLIFVAKIGVTIASILYLANTIHWADFLGILAGIKILWVATALGIFWLAQITSSARCAYIARALGGDLTMRASLRAHFIGLWFNQVLPTSLGGDVIKIAVLRKCLGLSVAIRSAILDRFSGLMFLMAFVAITLPLYFDLLLQARGVANGLVMLSLTFIAATFLLVWVAHTYGHEVRWRVLHKPMQLLHDIWLFRRGRHLWNQIWTSAIVHFNGIAAYSLLGLSLGVHVNFLTFALIVPLVFLIALLPISLAGWGIREAGSVWLFGIVGISKEDALAMSICYGLLLVISGLPGMIMLLSNNSRETVEREGA